MTEGEVARDARRERAADEDRATPLEPPGAPFHPSDSADALHPEEPLEPPPPPPPDRQRSERPPGSARAGQ
jgi:hypothetical protein